MFVDDIHNILTICNKGCKIHNIHKKSIEFEYNDIDEKKKVEKQLINFNVKYESQQETLTVYL